MRKAGELVQITSVQAHTCATCGARLPADTRINYRTGGVTYSCLGCPLKKEEFYP